MAAVGGLIFTGVATYYSAEVSQDQLEQSREESAQKARDQASRVTFWEENSFYGQAKGVHLVNRSPDPVSLIQVVLHVSGPGGGKMFLLADSSLPPCTEFTFNAADLKIPLAPKEKMPLSDTSWRVERFTFTDRNGQNWVRSPVFLAREAQVWSLNGQIKGVALPSGPAEVKEAAACEQDG